jgi:hypothetical protein
VELTAHIAHENYNAKSNRPLRVEANNFCEIPLLQPQKAASATQRVGGVVDEDLEAMTREQLIAEARRLRGEMRHAIE